MIKKLLSIQVPANRVFGLDILRAAAILFVVLGHSAYIAPSGFMQKVELFSLDGVSIFFVLSGFLIGGILIKTLEKMSFRFSVLLNFWTRRWYRTLPAYFFVLLILILFNFAFKTRIQTDNIFQYFIFSQNLFYPHPKFFPEAWSLNIEEWFYLTIPFLLYVFVYLLRLPSKKTIFAIAIFIILGVLILRFYRYQHSVIFNIDYWDIYFRKQVITRLDSLMYGVIGAWLRFYYPEFWKKQSIRTAIFGLSILILSRVIEIASDYHGMYIYVFSFSVNGFAVLLILAGLDKVREVKKTLFSKFLTYTSLISYSMYLINLSLIQLFLMTPIFKILNYFHLNVYLFAILSLLSYFILVYVFSVLMYKYIETPFMKYRDKVTVKEQKQL